MLISSKPKFNSKHLFNDVNKKPSFLSDNIKYFDNGSDALVMALKNLNIGSNSKIAIPAYICKTLTENLRSNNLVPFFYDINLDLSLDFDFVEKFLRVNNIEIILLVDFFGFYSFENINLSKKFKEKGYKVIIDRCHSALSSKNINIDFNQVDAMIFSLRKNFGSRDGGALIDQTPSSFTYKSFVDLKFIFVKFIENIVFYLGFPNIYSKNFENFKNKYLFNFTKSLNNSNLKFKEVKQSKLLSNYLFKQIFNEKIVNKICNSRIENFNKLTQIKSNKNLRIMFETLDDYTVPQVLPAIDESMSLTKFLNNQGIGSYRWPGNELDDIVIMCKDKFPNTISLNDKLVCLPIHQSLKSNEIIKIIECVTEWDNGLKNE
jgi:dTDP-4-amino-4,6-dideoxygalactose transaminase